MRKGGEKFGDQIFFRRQLLQALFHQHFKGRVRVALSLDAGEVYGKGEV